MRSLLIAVAACIVAFPTAPVQAFDGRDAVFLEMRFGGDSRADCETLRDAFDAEYQSVQHEIDALTERIRPIPLSSQRRIPLYRQKSDLVDERSRISQARNAALAKCYRRVKAREAEENAARRDTLAGTKSGLREAAFDWLNDGRKDTKRVMKDGPSGRTGPLRPVRQLVGQHKDFNDVLPNGAGSAAMAFQWAHVARNQALNGNAASWYGAILNVPNANRPIGGWLPLQHGTAGGRLFPGASRTAPGSLLSYLLRTTSPRLGSQIETAITRLTWPRDVQSLSVMASTHALLNILEGVQQDWASAQNALTDSPSEPFRPARSAVTSGNLQNSYAESISRADRLVALFKISVEKQFAVEWARLEAEHLARRRQAEPPKVRKKPPAARRYVQPLPRRSYRPRSGRRSSSGVGYGCSAPSCRR